MDFDEVVGGVVTVAEAAGVLLMVGGGLWSLAASARDAVRPEARSGVYELLRRRLARVILLGLEVLLLADIIRTIVVDQTAQSVLVLGVIVVIRIVLSFSLQVEIDGVWPWARGRSDPGAPVGDPSPGSLSPGGG